MITDALAEVEFEECGLNSYSISIDIYEGIPIFIVDACNEVQDKIEWSADYKRASELFEYIINNDKRIKDYEIEKVEYTYESDDGEVD